MAHIALLHALVHSMAPVNAAFERLWPEARRMNLLDDSLSADRAAGGGLDAAMHDRFQRLAQYAVDCGAQALLFTCSAFGPCIAAVAARHAGLPVLRPNEAMVDEATAAGGRIALLATFAPTLSSMPQEFPPEADLEPIHVPGALEALNQGHMARHDELIARAAAQAAALGCHRIVLAQFSMAQARRACEAASGLPVLTTVDSAVRALRQRLGQH